MNKDKENQTKGVNRNKRSKDVRNTIHSGLQGSKKTITGKVEGEELKKEVSKEKFSNISEEKTTTLNSRKSTHIRGANVTSMNNINVLPKENANLASSTSKIRKSVSPNVRGNASNIIVPKKSVKPKEEEAKPQTKEQGTQVTSLQSSGKRKYTEYAAEPMSEKSKYEAFEKSIMECFTTYEKGGEWKDCFFKAIESEITINGDSKLPKSMSYVGSKILTLQQFWLMLIDYIRAESSVEKIISLFNESFNYISEESLIKPFYLKTMKSLNSEDLVNYINSKSDNPYNQNKISNGDEVTNKVLFSLLESYAQFFLRSQSKYKPSEEKKKKTSSGFNHNPQKENFEITINSCRKEFLNNQIQTALNENIFIPNKPQIHDQPKIGNQNPAEATALNDNTLSSGQKVEISFTTPMRSGSKNKSQISEIHHSTDKYPSKSELRDLVDPLKNFTQKTDNMIVSQNTISKQMEFIHNINNANQGNMSIFSQNVTEETLAKINLSLQANLSQDTFYQNNCSFSQINQEEPVEDINKIDQVKTEEKENEVVENSVKENQRIGKNENILSVNKINCSHDSDEKILTGMEEENGDPIQENGNQEENSKRKLEEEKLDIIIDLSQNSDINHNLYNINGRSSVNNTAINHYSARASISSNKSRSKSRSKSRGRRYQSLVTEEYPDDLVEGSIRTFNKSFNGLESNTKSNLSSMKQSAFKDSEIN